MKQSVKDRVTLGLAVAIAALVLVEAVAIPHPYPAFPWHRVPGYAAAIGLGACLVVVQISKWLGEKLLQRPEQD